MKRTCLNTITNTDENKLSNPDINQDHPAIRITNYSWIKKIALIFVIGFLSFNSFGQDKKEVLENGIQVKRSYVLDIANGDKEPVIEKEEFYNFRGDLVEVKEYTDQGKTIDTWAKYKYDNQGNVVEEQQLNAKGEIKERFEYKYENGLKSEKIFYDNKNRLSKKKIFKYELRK